MSANLPAIPGGAGRLSDKLAVEGRIMCEAGNLLAEIVTLRTALRRSGVPIPRKLSRQTAESIRAMRADYSVARLRLFFILNEEARYAA